MKNKLSPARCVVLCFIFLWVCCCSGTEKAFASPWAEKEGYGAKTGGKLVFGLKHTLFSVFNPWAEAHDPVYESPWTGFCAGIGKSVVYTAAGAIQLVTFPIPVDFPDVGLGMHIPANHQGKPVKASKTSDGPDNATTAATAAAADLKTDTPSAAPAESPKTAKADTLADPPQDQPGQKAVEAKALNSNIK